MADDALAAGGASKLHFLQLQVGLSETVKEIARARKTMDPLMYSNQLKAVYGPMLHMGKDTLDIWVRQSEAIEKYNATQKDATKRVDLFTTAQDRLIEVFSTPEMMAEMTKDMNEVQKLDYEYGRATEGIASEFNKMWSELTSAWSKFSIAVEPVIRWLIREVLAPIIHYVSKIIGYAADFIGFFTKTSEAVKAVNKAAEPTVTWLNEFGDKVSSIWNALGSFAKGLIGVAAGFVAIGVTAAVISVFIGLWAKFMKVTSIPKLLSIAVAAVAVGYGIGKLAEALALLASLDYGKLWSAIGALAVVFGLLALAALGMSTGIGALAAFGVAAVLLLVAVACRILAGAAYLLAQAFDLAAGAFIKIGSVATTLADAVYTLALAFGRVVHSIISLSEASAGNLMAIGISLGVVAIGMGALGLSMAAWNDDDITRLTTLSSGALANLGTALQSLAPGITAFLTAMGTGFQFWYAMDYFASGLGYVIVLDSAKLLAISMALLFFGKALDVISRGATNLGAVGNRLKSFAGSIVEITTQLRSNSITDAFNSLLSSIPVIDSVTDAIASAIQVGQEKIKAQLDTLKASFAVLESIAEKLDVPVGALDSAPKKKVMAETISNIQVKTETSGGASARSMQEEMQAKQVELMAIIANAVSGLGSDKDVGVIRSLLEEHLPKLGESPSKLGTQLNNWS